MSKFIRESGGNLNSTENIERLENLATVRKPVIDIENIDMDNLIAQTHRCQIELVHFIRTEDKINCVKNELSNEMKTFSQNVSKEFLQDVLDPFCKNIVKFLEKHPEYIVKCLKMDSGVESSMSLAARELRDSLFG